MNPKKVANMGDELMLNISLVLHFLILGSVLLIQTVVDLVYSKDIILRSLKFKIILFLCSGCVSMFLVISVLMLISEPIANILDDTRRTSFFPIVILFSIMFYGLIGLVFAIIKGYFVRIFGLEGASVERIQQWWGYNLIGNIVTVFLSAPSYIILLILPPLFRPV